jgi:DUF971 family protein
MTGKGTSDRGASDAAYERRPHDAATTPRDLKVRLKDQKLVIDWSDGGQSEFDMNMLRRQCPCAGCRTEREQQRSNPLQILRKDPTGVRVVNARLVGNYAVQLVWSDGHDTGIFDFRFLRQLNGA